MKDKLLCLIKTLLNQVKQWAVTMEWQGTAMPRGPGLGGPNLTI